MADGDESKMIRLSSVVENDVQHLLNDQIRIREGAMKLMSACSTLNQALETSKNLLTINAKILGLMCALQKQKQECVLHEYNRSRSYSTVSRSESCTGQVAISDIRVPVMWKDNVHFTGKTGDQSFYAFALIRCGDKVRDTPLYEVTSNDTDMYFDEPLVFEDLQSDFKMEFELYYTVITANEKYGFKVPSKGSLNIKKRAIQFNAPKFALAGHTQLVVDDIKTGVISKDLLIGSKGASGVAVLGDASEFPAHPLELWGQFCCQLAAVPICMQEETFLGNCYVSNVDDKLKEQFLVLYQCELSCWQDQTMYSRNSKPIDAIKLTKNTEITKDGSIICIKSQATERSFRFTDESICSKSLLALENCVLNLQVWKLACEEVMYIPQSKKNKIAIPSKASFYDQIVIEKVTTPDLLRSNSSQSNPVLSVFDEHNMKIKETDSNIFSSVFEDSVQKISEAHFEGSLPVVFEHICQNDSANDSATSEQSEHMNSPNKNPITLHTSMRSLSNALDVKDNLLDEFSNQKSDVFNSDLTDNAEKINVDFESTTHGVEIPAEDSKVFFTESNNLNHNQSSDLTPSKSNIADDVPNSNLATNYVCNVSNLTTTFFNDSDTESDHSSTESNLATLNVNYVDSIQESDLAVVINESNHADHSTECNLTVPNLNIAECIPESGLSVVVTESSHADHVQNSNFVTVDDEDVKNNNFSEVEANHPNVTNDDNVEKDPNHPHHIQNSDVAVDLNHLDQVHESSHVVKDLKHLDLIDNLNPVIDNSNHPDHGCSFNEVQIQNSAAVKLDCSDHSDSFKPVITNFSHSEDESNVASESNNVCITQSNLSEIKYEASAIVDAGYNATEIVHVSNNISDISLNSDVFGAATELNRIDVICQTKDNENVVGSNIVENLNKANDPTVLIEESSHIPSDTNLKFTNNIESYPHNVNNDINELSPISCTATLTNSETPLILNDFTSNFQPSENNKEVSDIFQGHARGLESAPEKHDNFVSEIADNSEDFRLENNSCAESNVQSEKSGDVKENFPPGGSEALSPEFTETNLLHSVQHHKETEVKGELADKLP